MKVQQHTDVEAFYRQVEPTLIAQEAENNLVFGILNGIRTGHYTDFQLYTVQDGDRVITVSLRTPPHPLLISHPVPGTSMQAAIAQLAGHLYESTPDLTGVTGTSEVVAEFARHWPEPGEIKIQMRAYRLTKPRPVTGVPGQARRPREADRPILRNWYRQFTGEALGDETDEEAVEDFVSRYLETDAVDHGLFLWEVNDTPVSMAVYSGPTPNGCRVGGVYTPPEHRRRGYASACTAAITRHILDSGRRFAFLFTDLSNPTSNHIYQQIGYEPVCDVDTYHFR